MANKSKQQSSERISDFRPWPEWLLAGEGGTSDARLVWWRGLFESTASGWLTVAS